MSGSRMDLTKEALKLFIQSLPVGCSFAILGFGDKALFEVPNTDKGWSEPVPDAIWQYNEKTRESILKNISSFQANYGGTDILTPLQKAFSLQAGDMKKRVFMLTDGEDDQKNSIIAFARSNCEHMRIHTFGIGGDCDRKLIEGTASAGRGTSSFAVSKDDDLSGLVVNALKRAMLPSLGCEFNFFGKVQKREFFKDEPIKAYQILTKEVFEKA